MAGTESRDWTNARSSTGSTGYYVELPRNNPCAQCGKPISTPEWVEHDDHCVAYLWHCVACDYQFEAVAYFAATITEAALAA